MARCEKCKSEYCDCPPGGRRVHRSQGLRNWRGHTLSLKVLKAEARGRREEKGLARYRALAEAQRPRTRAECACVARPCPFVSCRYHLFLDVNPRTGSLKLNFVGKDPDELTESCALDVAERGGGTLEVVGDLTGLTRERIRQLEAETMRVVRRKMGGRGGAFDITDSQVSP